MTIRKDDTAKFKRQAIGLVVVGVTTRLGHFCTPSPLPKCPN